VQAAAQALPSQRVRREVRQTAAPQRVKNQKEGRHRPWIVGITQIPLWSPDESVRKGLVATNGVPMFSEHLAEEEATAYHEAGHAVVGAVRDRPPCWVTIVAADGAAGKAEFPNDGQKYTSHFDISPEKRCHIETRILTAVAGTIAHDLWLPGRAHDRGDERDDICAYDFIADAGWVGDKDRNSYFQQLQEEAHGLLKTHWSWVEAVARALIERKTLQREEVIGLRPKPIRSACLPDGKARG
jgi:hypothetical protein